MTVFRWIILDDDNTLFGTNDEPTASNAEAIGQTVVDVTTSKFYDSEVSLPEAEKHEEETSEDDVDESDGENE